MLHSFLAVEGVMVSSSRKGKPSDQALINTPPKVLLGALLEKLGTGWLAVIVITSFSLLVAVAAGGWYAAAWGLSLYASQLPSINEKLGSHQSRLNTLEQAKDGLATGADIAALRETIARLEKSQERLASTEFVTVKFEGIDDRLEQMDQRFAKIDGQFQKIDQRLDALDGRLILYEARLASTEILDRFDAALVTSQAVDVDGKPQVRVTLFQPAENAFDQMIFAIPLDKAAFAATLGDAIRPVAGVVRQFDELTVAAATPAGVWSECSYLLRDLRADPLLALRSISGMIGEPERTYIARPVDSWFSLTGELRGQPALFGLPVVAAITIQTDSVTPEPRP